MPSYRDFLPSRRLHETLSLSPDGSAVAYADDASGQFNLTARSLAGGKPRQLTSYVDSTVRRVAWHPDGRSLVFSADTRGDEKSQIFLINAKGGEPQPLTHSTGVQYLLAEGEPLSPDGRLLAYTGNDRPPHDQDVLVRDLSTGEVRRVYTGGGQALAGHWAPDGSALTVREIRDNSDHVVYLVPLDGTPAVRLTPQDTKARHLLGPWLPDGSGFLVRSNAGREFVGLAVMDPASGKLTWLDTPDWDVEELALSGDGRVLVWTVNVDGSSQLRARDIYSNTDLPMPALPIGVVAALALSHDGHQAVLRLSTPTRPPNLAVIDLTDGRLRWLTEIGAETADPAIMVEPALIHCPTEDGRHIPAYLYRPAHATGRVGILISVHGGPVHQERPVYVGGGFYQYLVSNGVAVIAPNVRGSQGYGISYQELIYRDWGGVDLADIADVTRWLHRQDWVDPDGIGLFGASYGGFVVLSCLARLPEFTWAAGVSLCGPSNLVTLAEASPPSWRSLVNTVIGDPNTDADFLMSRSPVTYAEHIHAPLFVIQGANDPRVPKQESDQIVERLRARGVEVRYDVYPDEGHGLLKRDNQIKSHADAGEFLLAHLKRTDVGGRESDDYDE